MYNPHDECMYYTGVTGVVKKIKYVISGNQPPIALFTNTPTYGGSPLLVNFDANATTDPENSLLTYSWNYGDGSTGSGILSSHQFVASAGGPQFFLVTLTVQDSQGATSQFSRTVSLNNSPPRIISTSLDNLETFATSGTPSLSLNAVVSDAEEANNSLTYKWEAFLCHNNHRHQELNVDLLSSNFILGLVPCDNILYYYHFVLTVTDSYGLSTVFQKDLFPNCNTLDSDLPSYPNLKVEQISTSGFIISWDPITDNDGIKNIQIFINGQSLGFVSGATNSYTYHSSTSIIDKNFKVYVVARDFASNASKSSVIDFTSIQNCNEGDNYTFVSDLIETSSTNGWGKFEKNKSNGENSPNDGNTLTLNGITYAKGLGTHATSEIVYSVAALGFENFVSTVGIDDEINAGYCGSVVFKVFKDNTLAFQSPVLFPNSAPLAINVNITGASLIRLVVENAGDGDCGDHGDWADAKLIKTNCISNDYLAPGVPLNLVINSQLSGYLLSWQGSVDNLDNSLEYEIFMNGLYLGITSASSYSLMSIPSGSNYFTVQAKDDSGNRSVSQIVFANICPNSLDISSSESISNLVVTKKAALYLSANNTISNLSNVEYRAGKSILLSPGFYVGQSVFVAKIEGCGN